MGRLIMIFSLCLFLMSNFHLFSQGSVDYKKEGKRFVEYVDPFIGTSHSRWMLFPGVTMPFGMVKLSPDNQKHVWKAGYDYEIDNIAGFSHIHSWATGGLLAIPTVGDLMLNPGKEHEPTKGYRSRIDKKTETAYPGYYSVFLKDYNIKAEITASTRSGFHRYTFPKSSRSRVIIDLLTYTEYGYMVDWGHIQKLNNKEISGFSKQRTFDGFSSLNNEYTVYFFIRFDKPFKSFNGFNENCTSFKDLDPNKFKGNVMYDVRQIYGHGDVGAFLEFDTKHKEVIKMQVGISLVSVEQARKNLNEELNVFDWEFDAVVKDVNQTWNKLLSKIEVEGDEQDKVKFYTNLYRSYSARTIWSDVDGKYVDMCEVQRQLPKGDVIYGCDAFWNTFWNLNQLWGLVSPNVLNSWVRSLLEIYNKGGWLPKGPTTVEYSSIMVASHQVALINSAYQKGIRNYDVQNAYQAIKDVMTKAATSHSCGGLVGNRQIEVYQKLGFVPHGEEAEKYHFGTDRHGPASNTLEYAYDDWNVAMMAKALGKKEDFRYFKNRSTNYKNIFNYKTKYMQAKYADGNWVPMQNISKAEDSYSSWSGKGFVEGNAWQYTFFVPHDVKELVKMIGREEFNNRLTKGFKESEKYNFNAPEDKFGNVYINHGNQPNMQAAYLFNYSGEPWKTQKWSRKILDTYYGFGPEDGWPGDEDQGQMGAWFVMSSMGLFQMNGGGGTNPFYEITSPLFSKIQIELDPNYYKGKRFTIEALNNSKKNIYIQEAYLNGKPLKRNYVYHSEITGGGVLKLVMGDRPNRLLWKEVKMPPSY